MLLFKLYFGFFFLFLVLSRSFLLNLLVLSSNVLSVLLLTHSVSAVKSFLQGSVKLMFLFFLFVVKDVFDVVKSPLVLLQKFLFFSIIQDIISFNLHYELVVL